MPRVYLLHNAPAAFQVPSVAFDGLTNFFSVPPGFDSALYTPLPNGTSLCVTGCPDNENDLFNPGSPAMHLSNDGFLAWTPQRAGLYVAQFTITSRDNGFLPRTSVPLEMEFAVVDLVNPANCPQQGPCPPPTFSPATPPSLVAPVGQPASFTVSASTFKAGDYVFLSATSLPVGSSFVQTDQSPDTTGNGLFSWTPTAADLGTHYACLRASEFLSGSVNYGMYCAPL